MPTSIAAQHILERVVEALPFALSWKDRSAAYIGCNARFAARAGLEDASEIAGLTDYDLFPADFAAALQADDRDVMNTGEGKVEVHALSRPDGVRRWIESNKSPLRDAQGAIVGVVGAYRDVTERMVQRDEGADTSAIVLVRGAR